MPTKTRARPTSGFAGGGPGARRPRTRAAARPRAKRAAGASLWRVGGVRFPELSAHQLDLLGLGLAALGVFLAFVLYLGAAGGSAGGAASDGLRLLLGQVAYATPVALVGGGLLLVARTLVPSLRPVRAGTLCLFAAVTLMLTAGTFGLGSDTGEQLWSAASLKANGGAVGAVLYWTTSHLFSTVGSHIIAIFLLLAGSLLLSGVTVASLLQRAAETTRSAATLAPRRAPAQPSPAARPVVPPEPEDERLVVRATHVEAPSLDGRERYPDLYGEEAPETEEAFGADVDDARLRLSSSRRRSSSLSWRSRRSRA